MWRNLKWLVPAIITMIAFFQCSNRKQELKTGDWRGVFWVDDEPVPFLFKLSATDGKTSFVVPGGSREDHYEVSYVGNDSIHVSPETFEYRLFAKIQPDGRLTGEYRDLTPGNTSRVLRFEAEQNKNYRFVRPEDRKKPAADLTGNWSLKIAERQGDAANRVATLLQEGNDLKGIVLAITGDTGDLAGEISGDEFWLSGFSGMGVTLVKGKIDQSGKISGSIGFGTKALHFSGERNESAALADAYSLTYLKPGFRELEVRLPNLKGDTVSTTDSRYKGKVLVIEILGSWCPNCRDQIEFLNPWYEKNKDRGVEVLGVAFEMKDDFALAGKLLGRMIDRYDIGYEILYGGTTDSTNVQSKFKALNRFLAFPTTIVVGRDGKVKAIHTGFSGRGTGKFYEEFVVRWNREMDKWLAEPAE
ncbi:hypothetical protein GCM10023091_30690 [Ravibacter arvi]|uniref:Thioredoxin domain-containing protein n=1 Tax=Ravibacter arvi TaxID=2051041 RepID=A0ABP8M209_9BACT